MNNNRDLLSEKNKKYQEYSVRSKSELLEIAERYSNKLNEAEANNTDESIHTWESLFRGLVKLLQDPLLDNFNAEHAVDAFLYVCNVRIKTINRSANAAYITIVTDAINELTHGVVIMKYKDLLRDVPCLYPIYFPDDPDCQCIPEYECSRRGVSLLEKELGHLPEFDMITTSRQ